MHVDRTVTAEDRGFADMDFRLSEQTLEWKDYCRKFARDVIRPVLWLLPSEDEEPPTGIDNCALQLSATSRNIAIGKNLFICIIVRYLEGSCSSVRCRPMSCRSLSSMWTFTSGCGRPLGNFRSARTM